MSEQTLQQRIQSARQAGYSDAEIYQGIKNSPRYQTQFKNSYDKGMTDNQIASGIGLNLSAQAKPQAPKQSQPKQEEIKPEKPSFLVRFGSGMDNVFSGIKQGALYAKDAVTGGDDYEKFTQAKAEEKKSYQQAKKDSGFSGIDVAEFLGETVAMAPLSVAGKGFQGANVLSKAGAKVIAQNAGLGALAGGVTFAENAEKRTDNAVLGATGGAVGAIVGKKIGDVVAKRMNASTANIDDALTRALSKTGLKLSDLSDDTVKTLRSQAKNAVKSGRALDDDTIARIAFLESKGFKPTKAQATRNATEWTAERELAKRKGAGDILTGKYVEDNQHLLQMLDDEIVATGGQKTDNYGMNQDILQTAQAKIQANKAKTRQAYDVAINAQGNDIPLDGMGFVSDAVTALDKNYQLSSMPAQVRDVLKSIQQHPDQFTLGKSQELIKVMNQAYKSSLNNGQPTSSTNAIKIVRDVLEQRQQQAMQSTLVNGTDAGQAWNIARQQHKQSRQLIDSMPLLKDVERGVEPDNLFSKHILKGNIAELDRTIKFLQTENPQVVADIKQSIVEYIAHKSVNQSGAFSPAKMKQALDSLGDRRLQTMFSTDELKRLKDIQMAGHYLMQQPMGANVNHSNTSSALYNVLTELLERVPFVNIGKNLNDARLAYSQLSPTVAGQKINQSADIIDQLTKIGWITGANSASGE